MDLGLAGRTALITGAASGIGRATAALMAAEGARILLIDQDKDGAHAAAGELAAARGGLQHVPITADLSTADGVVTSMCEALAAAAGAIDIVVSAAGTCRWRTLGELTDEDWLDSLKIHLLAPVRMMRILLPPMLEHARARAGRDGEVSEARGILFVTSDLASRPEGSGPPDYQAAKAALQAYMRSVAAAAAPHIRVNAVAPGLVASPMTYGPGGLAARLSAKYGVPPDQAVAQELRGRGQLLARPGRPEEIARVIAMVISSPYIEAGVVTADGGSHGA
jgi:3-oxoacyl-[acyl-carrier protein] reductase